MVDLETIKSILNGNSIHANALEHEIVRIVEEVRNKGIFEIEFVIMYNSYFLSFDDFKSGWKQELKRLLAEFDVNFSLVERDSGNILEFYKSNR